MRRSILILLGLTLVVLAVAKTIDVIRERRSAPPKTADVDPVKTDDARTVPLAERPVAPPEPEPPAEPERVIAKGETAVLTDGIQDVRVANASPVADDAVEVSEGSSCDVSGEGTLTIVGVKDDGILVRYRKATKIKRLPKKEAAGDQDDQEDPGDRVRCPNGTLFFVSKYDYLKDTEPSRSADVRRMLEEEAGKPAKIRKK